METLQPKLRFPEFKENWEKVKLKDVSKYFNGGSFENDVKEDGKYELITLKSVDMNGNLAHSKRYLDVEIPTLKKNTLIMILSEQSPGLLGMTAMIPIDNKYVLNQRVAEIRPNNEVHSYFLSLTINRSQQYFSKLGAGTKVQNISKPNVENFEFLYPSVPEQTRIANFLSAIDEKLHLLKEKKALLEEYKKGMMQKIFNQDIRFKDDNGDDFEDWEEKSLQELCDYKNGGSFEKHVCEDGIYNLISLNSIDINGKIKQKHKKVSITDNSLQKGDLIMVLSDVAHGNFLGLTDIVPGDNFVLNQRMGALKPKENFSRFYLKTYINFNQSYFKLMGQGSSQQNLSKGDIESFVIKLPCLQEQTKIAQFLSAIDDKISLVGNQIEETVEYKKGLLQGMFV